MSFLTQFEDNKPTQAKVKLVSLIKSRSDDSQWAARIVRQSDIYSLDYFDNIIITGEGEREGEYEATRVRGYICSKKKEKEDDAVNNRKRERDRCTENDDCNWQICKFTYFTIVRENEWELVEHNLNDSGNNNISNMFFKILSLFWNYASSLSK